MSRATFMGVLYPVGCPVLAAEYFRVALVAGACMAILIACAALAMEYRHFRRRGLGGQWVGMRLALVPIAAIVVAGVLTPARLVAGPEALAVFYGLLLFVAPPAWFGLHRLARWLLAGELSVREAMFLAASPLGFALGLVSLAHMLQGPAWSLANALVRREFAQAPEAAAPLELQHAYRYRSREGEFLLVAWDAPSPVAVVRVDLLTPRGLLEDVARSGYPVCREADGVRWLGLADTIPNALRVYWRDGGQRLLRADLPAPAEFESRTWAVRWGAESPELPEPLPWQALAAGHTNASGELHFNSITLRAPPAGADQSLNCLGAVPASDRTIDAVAVQLIDASSQLRRHVAMRE